MPAPSQLAIHASALQRLVKEESSYQVELKQQEARIAKLEQGSTDENAEYILRQEVGSLVTAHHRSVSYLVIQNFTSIEKRFSDA